MRRTPPRTLCALLIASLTVGGVPNGYAELPVACGGGACAGGPSVWVTSGQALRNVNGNTLQIQQQSDRAILNWATFNVGAGERVQFEQPSSSSVALNRIFDQHPSQILGSIDANGQIYLINPNGMLFGEGVRINTNALIASTLDVDDAIFNGAGIGQAINQGTGVPAFEGNSLGTITIASGAEIEAQRGGRVFIFGSEIFNHGKIETPEGQTVLAASRDRVFLQASDDPLLRGFFVEVGTGGSVENLGEIIAERGNVTLAGLAVNQAGRLTATTSLQSAGSVRLLARDSASIERVGNDNVLIPNSSGSLTLAANSITEVRPDLTSADRAVDDQPQPHSSIALMGREIRIGSGAHVEARSGDVAAVATRNPRIAVLNPDAPIAPNVAQNDSRLIIEPGAVIDVSGLDDAVLPMSRNVAEVELRANELADAPLQRNGVLRGATVRVDVRKGTPLANVQGAIDSVQRGLSERLATGGNVMLASEGDVVLADAARVDISGGQVEFLTGILDTTRLISHGEVVDIGSADPNRHYEGFASSVLKRHTRWGVTESFSDIPGDSGAQIQPGYVEGKDAGTLKIVAHDAVIGGEIDGHAVQGRWQREPTASLGTAAAFDRPYDQLAKAGSLAIDLGPNAATIRDVGIATTGEPSNGVLSAAPDVLHRVQLSTHLLTDGGLGSIAIGTNGTLTTDAEADLNLPAGASLELRGGELDLAGDIRAAGGDVRLRSGRPGVEENARLRIRENVTIDVSGAWINDMPAQRDALQTDVPAPLHIDGGSIDIFARGDLRIGPRALLNVSGGAHYSQSDSLTAGQGGSISVTSQFVGGPTQFLLDAIFLGYGLDRGGSLSISGNEVIIAPPQRPPFPPPAGDPPADSRPPVVTSPALFTEFGFENVSLTANRGDLVVTVGTHIAPQQRNLVLGDDFLLHRTGESLLTFASAAAKPADERRPVNVALNALRVSDVLLPSQLLLESGSTIDLEPGARLQLTTNTKLVIDDHVSAPGGSVSAHIVPLAGINFGFESDQAIWLTDNASIDVSGVYVPTINDLGLDLGQLFAGGTVSLTADRGHVITLPESRIDVSGVARTHDVIRVDGVVERINDYRSAGSVDVSAADGIYLAGNLTGERASASGASGGTLSVKFDTANRDAPAGDLTFPTGPRELFVANAFAARDFVVGGPIRENGIGEVPVGTLAQRGFDSVELVVRNTSSAAGGAANGRITFVGDTALAVGDALTLDAAVLEVNGNVELAASYLSLGHQFIAGPVTGGFASGDGTLAAHADLIDLRGQLRIEGAERISLASAGDIRLIGELPDDAARELQGGLLTDAGLVLSADRIYPSSLTQYRIEQQRDGGTVEIRSNGGAPADLTPLLSAGGAIEIDADRIVQSGVLQAPGGTISLRGADTLEVTGGSLTSVSLDDAAVLLGQTQGQLDWIYPLPNSRSIVFDGDVAAALRGVSQLPPEKRLQLDAAAVVVADGAVVDTRGGGQLLAYEFVPGPGGSRDVLNGSDGSFAIVPTLGNGFGAFDTALFEGFDRAIGDGLELSGVGGIPNGRFAMLPARYALLPGAFLVVPRESTENAVPDSVTVGDDGVATVSGRMARAGTQAHDAGWSAFDVLTRDQVLARSEFAMSSADDFFAERAQRSGRVVPRLPADAGNVRFSVDDTLEFFGSLLATSVGHGRRGTVDVEATDIRVTESDDDLDGAVRITPEQLDALGAASLLLGGRRTRTADGFEINVAADRVRIDAGANVTAPDVIAVAHDRIELGAGAVIASQAAASTDGANDEGAATVSGDAAILRVTNGTDVVDRTNFVGLRGSIEIAEGARLEAAVGGAVQIDAPLDVRMAGDVSAVDGVLAVGASNIALTSSEQQRPGLVLTAQKIGESGARDLRLRSNASIDVEGGIALSLDRLTLDAPGIAALTDGTTSFAARQISFGNASDAVSVPNGAPHAAQLALTADRWEFSGGEFGIGGFERVSARIAERVSATADADVTVSGDLDVATPLVIATGGAQLGFDVVGTAMLDGVEGLTGSAAAPLDSLGGAIEIAAARLDIATRLMARGGNISLTANGSDDAALLIDAGGLLDVSGLDVVLGGQSISVAAGSVALRSGGGVEVRAGAQLGVRGSDGGGDAGSVVVKSGRGTALAGALDSRHTTTAQGGTVRIQQQAAVDLDTLSATFLAAGFSHEISVGAGEGNLALGAGHTLSADRIQLVADGGSIEIAGIVQAPGERGTVDLDARDSVAVAAGGTVSASDRIAVNVAGADGALRLQSGSTLAIANPDGEIRLRVARGTTPLDQRVTMAGALPADRSTVLEAALVVDETDGIITGADTSAWFADLSSFMADSASLAQSLGQSANSQFAIRPGLEVRADGNMTLAQPGWDLSSWRFDGVPGSLVLRAGGTLTIGGDLSDGAVVDFDPIQFAEFDRLLPDASWDVTLIGGADLTAARTSRTVDAGDVVIDRGIRVRTGTGRLTAAAGRDFVLADGNSVLYTMGKSTGVGPWPELYRDLLLPKFEFPTAGGDISIVAGRDVVGAKTPQLVSHWMERIGGPDGTSNLPTTYGVLPGLFRENVGSLGGGSVDVVAGRDVRDLSVELPVTAQHAGDVAVVEGSTDIDFTDNTALIQGGGDLSITSERDVIGGFAYVGKGIGTIRASGSVRPEADGIRGLLVALADATIDVVATGVAHLESALNPTVLPEVNRYSNGAFYFTYAPDAAVSLTSLTGDAVLGNDRLAIARSTDLNFSGAGGDRALNLYPGTLSVTSVQGDLRLGRADASDASFALYPAQRGGLTLLARNSVLAGDDAAVEVNVSDADPALLPNVDVVAISMQETLERIPQIGTGTTRSDRVHARVPIHAGDVEPTRIIAQDGDIRGEGLVVSLPEAGQLHAGRDIRLDQAFLQNVGPTDISVLEAGRDIALEARRDPETGNVSNSQSVIRVSGPGRLDVIAGRDLDLGTSEGILSVGDLFNPGLADDGAAVTLFAGVAPGVDYSGFVQSRILTSDAYSEDLTDYMRVRLADPALTTDDAIAAFAQLPVEAQRPFVLNVFFDELKASGTDNANDPSVGFARGFAAIDGLFPKDRPYDGDFTLFFSRAQTQDGGDINVLVPGGLVNAGLTATFSGAKSPDQLGVVAQRAGDVNAFVKDDFQVNQSRVFALDGGDILIWSSEGDIDAGRGAKTALAAPQPKVTFDENGNVVVEFPPAISGSGIRNAVSTPGRKPGDVFLIAPAGIVNAGDAGIGVAGNLIVAAQQVIGTDNIAVGGQAIGVTLDTGGLAAGLTNVSDAGASASNAAEASVASNDKTTTDTSMSSSALGWLEVFLEGYGESEGDCDPERDPNCHAKVH